MSRPLLHGQRRGRTRAPWPPRLQRPLATSTLPPRPSRRRWGAAGLQTETRPQPSRQQTGGWAAATPTVMRPQPHRSKRQSGRAATATRSPCPRSRAARRSRGSGTCSDRTTPARLETTPKGGLIGSPTGRWAARAPHLWAALAARRGRGRSRCARRLSRIRFRSPMATRRSWRSSTDSAVVVVSSRFFHTDTINSSK